MAIGTYSELQSAVADWLNRDDLTTVIPNFVELAEAELTRNLRHRKMITRASLTISAEYTATPSDWFQTQSLILETDPVTQLEYLTSEALNAKRASSVASGKPLFFTMIGTEIQAYPSPDASYTGEIVYYAEIPALTDSNTTNWLLTLAPDIYLYATLIQSAPYLQDDARLQTWASLYQKKMLDIDISNERAQGQTSPRMRSSPLE